GLAPSGTTARTLAPSKEAFDTPLSPPPLDDEPGPATGRSDTYPDGTPTRWPGPASRTQHAIMIAFWNHAINRLCVVMVHPCVASVWSTCCHETIAILSPPRRAACPSMPSLNTTKTRRTW